MTIPPILMTIYVLIISKTQKIQNWTDFLLCNWVQNKGSLSMFLPGAFIWRNMVIESNTTSDWLNHRV